jgi:hypothetical protein
VTEIAEFRARLDEAERSLDEGDYLASVRQSAEVYAALVQERPDLVFEPPSFAELHVDGGRQPGAGVPHAPWPEAQGVTVSLVEGAAPEIVLAKSRYTMSDAITCLEYVVDLLAIAER